MGKSIQEGPAAIGPPCFRDAAELTRACAGERADGARMAQVVLRHVLPRGLTEAQV